MRTVGSTGRRSETKENLFSFCERGGTEGFCEAKSYRTTKRVKDKKLAFFFLSEEERKDFAKRNFNPLASAIKIK